MFFLIARSLRQHALSTLVTGGSVALAVGLTMAVLMLNVQIRNAFTGGPVGFDAVLGARGSQLQLVLNTVFHLETSPGNLPWSAYQAIRSDPRVELAIPYAVGDNYRGLRIVGTTVELFTKFEYQMGRKFEVEPGGKFFDPQRREAVVGSFAAHREHLSVGTIIHPYHGVVFDESSRHEEEYVVVGVLKPTNSPSDQVVWIPLEGIYRMQGHVLRGSGEPYAAEAGQDIPEQAQEVSAVMLKLKSPQAGFALEQTVNKQGKVATLAWPIGKVMAEVLDKLGWVVRVLDLLSYLVMLVAGCSILASVYNTILERRREFAILRALGARRSTVFTVVVGEAMAISTLGSLLGYAVYAVILLAAAYVIRAQTGVVLNLFEVSHSLVTVPLAMIALGGVAGLLPAHRAYTTDVAENLQATS